MNFLKGIQGIPGIHSKSHLRNQTNYLARGTFRSVDSVRVTESLQHFAHKIKKCSNQFDTSTETFCKCNYFTKQTRVDSKNLELQ